jgi:hypothetical protein
MMGIRHEHGGIVMRSGSDRLRAIGTEIVDESAADGLIRFQDNDGITREVIAS